MKPVGAGGVDNVADDNFRIKERAGADYDRFRVPDCGESVHNGKAVIALVELANFADLRLNERKIFRMLDSFFHYVLVKAAVCLNTL